MTISITIIHDVVFLPVWYCYDKHIKHVYSYCNCTVHTPDYPTHAELLCADMLYHSTITHIQAQLHVKVPILWGCGIVEFFFNY